MTCGVVKASTLAAVVASLVTSASASAQGNLERGWAAYERGEYAQAAELIRPYAEQGDPEAQFKLGRMYQTGQGIPRSFEEAVKWYRLAAETGQPFAQNNLGVMYKNGWGVPQDNVEAYYWFSLAVRNYLDFEEMNLERARQNRLAVASKMTGAEITAAQELTKAWVPKPYTHGPSTKLLGP